MYSQEQPSPAYQAAVRAATKFHANSQKFEGLRTLRSYNQIDEAFKQHDVKTALDYGCGKGRQHEAKNVLLPDGKTVPSLSEGLGVKFTLYDPCWAKFKRRPIGTFDAVLVVDVLEYVPDEDILWVLNEIFGYANSLVYIVASTIKPTKLVSDDYYRLEDWWLDRMVDVGQKFITDWRLRLRIKSEIHYTYTRDGYGYREITEEQP